MKRLRGLAVSFSVGVILVALNVDGASAEEVTTVIVGQQKVIDLKRAVRVAVGDEKIADVNIPSGKRQIIIIGKSPGVTDLIVWDDEGNKNLSILKVIAKDTGKIEKEVRSLIDGIEGVKVKVVGDKIIMDGVALTQEDMEKIKRVEGCYPEVVNLVVLNLGIRNRALSKEIEKKINLPGVKVSVNGDKAILKGNVFSEYAKEEAEKVASAYFEKVTNLLTVRKTMVEIDVTFAQVDISKGKEVGANILNNVAIKADSTFQGGAAAYSVSASALTSLRALVDEGKAQILSKPHLSTASGKEAKIHVGGEIGYEVSGTGSADVKWKQYGLILTVKPAIGKSGDVQISISIEVSAPIQSGRTSEKAFTTFRTESDLICREGESIVISGLVHSVKNRFKQKVPLLGDIPLLGTFFSHTSSDKTGKELVVTVTPTVPTIFSSGAQAGSSSYNETISKAERGE